MIRFIPFVFFLVLSYYSSAQSLAEFFSRTDVFLKKYVANGLVDYKSLKKDPKELNALYALSGRINLEGKSDPEKKAVYINTYNIAVIYSIVKYYPIKSPLDHAGFFDKEKHKVAGDDITLDVLEKQKLIGTYSDARFHFVLVCAAKSCPPLLSEAFTPDKLEQQLNAATTSALNDKNFIKVYPAKKKVELSKIFEWYKNDFAGKNQSVLDWINQYRKEKIPGSYSADYYEYNWSLNEK